MPNDSIQTEIKNSQGPPRFKIVIIDDDREDFLLIQELLKDIDPSQYQAVWIPNYDEGLAEIRKQEASAYLLDFHLGEKTGLELLAQLMPENLNRPMILLTGRANRETDLAAMREGASDFLAKSNLTAEVLERSIRYSMRRSDDLAKQRAAKKVSIARESADAANQAKSRFLAHMSHEIRSPLAAILGFTELAQDQALSSLDRNKFLEIIKRNGNHLLDVVNDILDLSKVEVGNLEVELQHFNWREIVSEVVKSLEQVALAKGLYLSAVLDGTAPLSLKGDRQRFRQILINMLSNAIKFTKIGGVTVRSNFNSLENVIEIEVEDTGIGISERERDRLFQPFSQADSSISRKFGGTGLGLDLSRKLARALSGDLVLTSSIPQKGSVFTLTLPVGEAQIFENSLPKAAKRVRSFPAERMKVLVVEDSKDNQLLIQHFLKATNIDLKCADNGLAGVNAASLNDFDAILMDIQMPEMDGYEATKQLRKSGYSKPIIALTAHAFDEEREKVLSSGFTDFVSKPIDRERLLSALYDSPTSVARSIQ
jgi:signal transduction histidine kinase